MPSAAAFRPASTDPSAPSSAPRRWQNLWVRLAVALAFADASIVVLALPQIVDRLHTPISRVTWVIMAYNLALIVASVAVVVLAPRLRSAPTLIAGLVVFGLASIGCGAANSVWPTLIVLRCLQGLGGALVLAASLPLFAQAARPGDSPLTGWSAAAAVGAAIGPAAGGVLTQAFDWRSIFFAQAPVAAVAAVAVLMVRREHRAEPPLELERPPSSLDPLSANAALLLFSAGIIGALFLVVIELINAWLISPIGAAAIVTTIPVATALAERLVRGRSAILLGGAGAVLLAAGLVLLSLVHHRALGWVVIALALCGAGIGLAFPGLTTVALESGGSASARAAKTVAARDAGLVLGLLILTPIFAGNIAGISKDKAPVTQVEAALIRAPLPAPTKLRLAVGLLAAYKTAGKADVPRVDPVFNRVRAGAPPDQQPALRQLQATTDRIVQAAVTPAFRWPYRYAALFALAVLPLLALRLASVRRATGPPSAPLPAR